MTTSIFLILFIGIFALAWIPMIAILLVFSFFVRLFAFTRSFFDYKY